MHLLRYLLDQKHALSFHDLQESFPENIDKSTLYRNLSNFEEAGLIHRINDHTGLSKYAISSKTNQEKDHAHFVCEQCDRVFCVEGTVNLDLKVPAEFRVKESKTIINGVCAQCA